MPEGLELPESHEHEDSPLTIPVSVTIAILAVLVAMATLLGHRAHTKELLLQAQASDQWAYYQAKNIRLRQVQAFSDLFSVTTAKDQASVQTLHDKYAKEADRYQKDKDEISDKATKLEEERDLNEHKADRFDSGEGLLDVGLVICSITLLTKRRFFWFSGILVGAVGVAFTLSAFLLH